ncbi:MAG: hypothetical protein C0501_26500 [Isosphaera sp.]|nr:hypothetical protein [Isosphaera sp.]
MTMTADSLAALIGQPVASPLVQALIRSGRLRGSSAPDGEGEERRHYLSDPEAGYELTHVGGRIVTAFLYVRPSDDFSDGFSPFGGTLPDGLSLESTRADVRRALGEPPRSGEARISPGLGRKGAWDRYDRPAVSFHIQYTDGGEQVQMITLMAPDVAP